MTTYIHTYVGTCLLTYIHTYRRPTGCASHSLVYGLTKKQFRCLLKRDVMSQEELAHLLHIKGANDSTRVWQQNTYMRPDTKYLLTYIHTILFTYFFLTLHKIRGKSLLELWVTTFLPDWQPPLIFVRFISNSLCMCSNSMASAHVILK